MTPYVIGAGIGIAATMIVMAVIAALTWYQILYGWLESS